MHEVYKLGIVESFLSKNIQLIYASKQALTYDIFYQQTINQINQLIYFHSAILIELNFQHTSENASLLTVMAWQPYYFKCLKL